MARLTRRYARYSRSAGGLSNVLAGVLALVAYGVGALAPPDGAGGRLALAAAPFVWIAVKEVLCSRYYQRLGRVRELLADEERGWHAGFTAFTALVSAVVIATVFWRLAGGEMQHPLPGLVGHVAVVAVMPLLVWRLMRTPLEFIVGVFLVCQAPLMLGGSHYAFGDQATVAAVILLVVGAREHLEFVRLERELEDLGSFA